MKRLTTYYEGVAILENYEDVYSDKGYKRGEAVSLLSEYENTNLEPSEIVQLKSENAVLLKALELACSEWTDCGLLDNDENCAIYTPNCTKCRTNYFIQQASDK